MLHPVFFIHNSQDQIWVVCKVSIFSLISAGKELEVMKEKGERAEELEIRMQKLERDNESLQKKVASLGITCEKVRCILIFNTLCFMLSD